MIVAHARMRILSFMAPGPLGKDGGPSPSVRPERLRERELQGSLPLSPCLRAHRLTTSDTLPQSSASANKLSAANNDHLVVKGQGPLASH